MLKLILILLITVANGHLNKLQNDADLESELMPQELNPTFIPDKDEPWKAVMPLRRRRETTFLDTTTTNTFKLYSRIATCVILALSAIIEISVYLIETYVT
ncbi:unnamed protein product, partial [Iphiclides podalirius]